MLLLVDLHGGIYARCGLLPRKKITVPKEYYETGLNDLEPTISVGPVLGVPSKDQGLQAVLAAHSIRGR